MINKCRCDLLRTMIEFVCGAPRATTVLQHITTYPAKPIYEYLSLDVPQQSIDLHTLIFKLIRDGQLTLRSCWFIQSHRYVQFFKGSFTAKVIKSTLEGRYPTQVTDSFIDETLLSPYFKPLTTLVPLKQSLINLLWRTESIYQFSLRYLMKWCKRQEHLLCILFAQSIQDSFNMGSVSIINLLQQQTTGLASDL